SIALGRAGALVAVNYNRDAGSAAATVGAIERGGGTAFAIQAAVQHRAQDEAMVAAVMGRHGPIGILVSNAGTASRGNVVADTSPDECGKLLDLHAIAAHHLSRLVLPAMRTLPRGDIIMMSSAATHMLEAGGAPYNMAKAAVEAL